MYKKEHLGNRVMGMTLALLLLSGTFFVSPHLFGAWAAEQAAPEEAVTDANEDAKAGETDGDSPTTKPDTGSGTQTPPTTDEKDPTTPPATDQEKPTTPDAKPDPTPDPKPDAKPDPKPDPKPEPKPDPKPEPEKPVTYKPGWNKDDKGQWHYGNADGKARTGWLKEGGTWYYLDPTQGGLMRTGRYQDTTGNWYYSNGSGAMQSGGWIFLGGKWYYLNGNGSMHRGWLLDRGKWYWLEPAAECAMATGLYQANGRWYTSGGDGACRMGGWSLVNGKWYWTTSSGATASGWIKPNGLWYWLEPSKHGEMATGLYQANGRWYTSGPDGSCRMNGWSLIGDKWYWADSSGATVSGWIRPDGKWYWLEPSKHGEMATGFYEANGREYYSVASGAMVARTWVTKDSKTMLFADANGALNAIGMKLADGGIALKGKDDKPLTGWQNAAGCRFYADPAKGGKLATGWVQVDGKWYLTDGAGAIRTGWAAVNGSWYWLEPSKNGEMATGWKAVNGAWYYLSDSGAMATGWLQLGSTWYYLSGSGAMVTGRQRIGGTWYDFASNGAWIDPSASMNAKAQGIASSTPWLILVDTANTRVNVYRGSQGHWSLQQSWLCAPGAPATPTVKGYFTVGSKGYYFDSGASRCFYYTQFRGNYLFHSTLYNKRPTPSSPQDNRVGMQLSHGCVRLELQNAKWIYDNIPRNTKVYVF